MRRSFSFMVCALFVLTLVFSGCARQIGSGATGTTDAAGSSSASSDADISGTGSNTGTPIINDRTREKAETKAEVQGFKNIYFDFDRYSLSSSARSALKHDAGLLKRNSSMRIIIEGHCDERGTNEYNIALGDKRAKVVKKYLMKLGVSKKRIDTNTFGEEKPSCTESSESCWQKNRVGKILLR